MEDSRRKKEHLELSLNVDMEDSNISNGLSDYRFIHNGLPDLSSNDIKIEVELFGKKLDAPL